MTVCNIVMESTASFFVFIMMIGSTLRIEKKAGLKMITFIYTNVLLLLVSNIIVNLSFLGKITIIPSKYIISFNYLLLYILLLVFFLFTQYFLLKRGEAYSSKNQTKYVRMIAIISIILVLLQFAHLVCKERVGNVGFWYQTDRIVHYFLYFSFWIPVLFNVIILIKHRACLSRKELIVLLLVQLGSAPFYVIDWIYHTRSFYLILALEVPTVYIYIASFLEGRLKEMEEQIESNRAELLAVQVHPHFVLNTLTTVRALCRKNPEEAIKALDFLSVYMQGILRTMTKQEIVNIKSEIEFIEAYLEIQKMRYGNKLILIYDIEDIDFDVPALCLQPLVENAIRHGVCNREVGGTVKIIVSHDEGYYYLTVEDNGVGFDADQINHDGKRHIGIQNVKERLLLSRLGELLIESKIGVGTKATIKLPRGEKDDNFISR